MMAAATALCQRARTRSTPWRSASGGIRWVSKLSTGSRSGSVASEVRAAAIEAQPGAGHHVLLKAVAILGGGHALALRRGGQILCITHAQWREQRALEQRGEIFAGHSAHELADQRQAEIAILHLRP